jgi:dsRNA-specific ribonuclease
MASTTTLETLTGIYLGNRGIEFKRLITSLLKKGKLKKKYIAALTTPESMEVFSAAFTSELVDEEHNYQVYEQLGDLSGNKFIVQYFYRRFPQLKCADGVKVVARLRINYGAKQSFCEIARELGFWNFISATNDLRQRKMKPLLEDVFEAFLGAMEDILDREVSFGLGYPMVYKVLKAIFDDMDISLKYEDLYDAKTRLKELFDMHEDRLGPLKYQERKEDLITYSSVYRVQGGRYEVRANGSVNRNRILGGRYMKIGEGSAALKSDAQQRAAAEALKTLATQGWKKPPPAIYQRFASGEEKKEEVVTTATISEYCNNDIDAQLSTKPKSKYQSKYTSTVLGMYCRKRNYVGIKACLELKANPNELDSEGLSALDLLLIGPVDEKLVKKVMKKFMKLGSVSISQNIMEVYYSKYSNEWFSQVVANLHVV